MSYGFTDAYPHARVTLMTRRLLPQGAIAAALDKSLQENAPLFSQTEAQLLLQDDADQQLRSMEQRRLSLLLNDVTYPFAWPFRPCSRVPALLDADLRAHEPKGDLARAYCWRGPRP